MNRKRRGKRRKPDDCDMHLTVSRVVPTTSATKKRRGERAEHIEAQRSARSTCSDNGVTVKDRELAKLAIRLMVSRMRHDGRFIALSEEAETLTEGMMAERSTVNSARLAHVPVGVAVVMDKLLATINTDSYNAILLSLMFDGSITLHEARIINKGLRERGLLHSSR